METVLLGLGLVLLIEGALWALAPGAVEALLRELAKWPLEARRTAGLLALTLGVACLWGALALGLP